MENNEFKYTYTAPSEAERKQIDSIRRQYLPKEQSQSKLERLKWLDNKVKQLPQIVSLILGIIGTLIFGLGIACILEFNIIWLGIILGILGIVPIIAAYPVHNRIIQKNKLKYREEILSLSKELLGE